MTLIRTGLATAMWIGLIASVAVPARAPQSRSSSGSSGSGVVSPTVFASWFASGGGRSGPAVLQLLVLWRGTPGWFMRGNENRDKNSGGQSQPIVVQMLRGGLDLELTFDMKSRMASIQGKEISLGDSNVLLIDHVDAGGGLTVVAKKIDGQLAESTVPILPLLRRSPELVSFLQCDLRLADPKAQPLVDLICSQVTGR